jgi:photosystem II stability/assembly factor-like uncharacterized protein
MCSLYKVAFNKLNARTAAAFKNASKARFLKGLRRSSNPPRNTELFSSLGLSALAILLAASTLPLHAHAGIGAGNSKATAATDIPQIKEKSKEKPKDQAKAKGRAKDLIPLAPGSKNGDVEKDEEGGDKEVEAEKDDPEGRKEWWKYWYGPSTNDYYVHAMVLSKAEVNKWAHLLPGTHEHMIRSQSLRATDQQWVNIGPMAGSSVQNSARDPNIHDTGRPTALLPHPTIPNILYAAQSNGGMWACYNADLDTSDDWNWVPITDHASFGGNQSIGAACFKHDDPDTMYVTLGDMMPAGGPENGPAEGKGFYIGKKSGDIWTWQQGGSLGRITRTKTVVSLPGNVILVAGNMGLFRSVDGGLNFARVQSGPLLDGTGGSNDSTAYPPNKYATAWDIVALNNGDLVLSYQFCDGNGNYDGTGFISDSFGKYGGGGVAYSTDRGATWAKSAFAAGTAYLPDEALRFGRIALVASSNTLYGFYQRGGVNTPASYSFPTTLIKSVDGGRNWLFNDAMGLFSEGGNGQTGYNHLVAVDPQDPALVFVGADTILYRSTDGGTNFSRVTDWLSRTYQYMHPDMHLGAWSTVGPKALYIGTDGGMSIIRDVRRDIPKGDDEGRVLSDPTFIDHRRNKNWPVHLVYGIGSTNASTPANSRERILIGTQDNGTLVRRPPYQNNLYEWTGVGGDGFGCLVHPYNGDLMLGSYYYTQIRRSIDGGASFSSNASISGSGSYTTAPFFTRIHHEMADPTGDTVYTFTYRTPYRSTNFGQSWTAVSTDGWPTDATTIRNMNASPLKQGLIGVLFDLDQSGITTRRGSIAISHDSGTTWQFNRGVFPNCAGSLSCLAFDTQDSNIMYVGSTAPATWNIAGQVGYNTYNHLWKSTDGGTIWTAIDGAESNSNGFPYGVRVHVIRVNSVDNNIVYVGTDFGVYFTIDQGLSWERFGSGLPMVQVSDMYLAPDSSFMRVGTHGRGVWEMNDVTSNFAPVFSSHPADGTAYMGQPFTFAARAVASPPPAFQWQVSTNGTAWTDITGATSGTFTATFGTADTGKRFRLVATNSLGTVNSDAATLTVLPYFDIDGVEGVDVRDLLKFMSIYGSTNASDVAIADFNGDGVIDDADLAMFLSKF